MKKLFIAAVIVMAGAWGVYQTNQNNNAQLNDTQMENIEALARGGEATAGTFCVQVNPYDCLPNESIMKGIPLY